VSPANKAAQDTVSQKRYIKGQVPAPRNLNSVWSVRGPPAVCLSGRRPRAFTT